MKKVLGVLATILLCCVCLPARADLITIRIEATVNYVSDYCNLLEGKVSVGSIITGTYTYDTSTPDTNPSSQVSEYWYYSSPCGINWNVGGIIFNTDPTNTKFVVGIANDYIDHPGDGYWISSSNNSSLDNGVQVDSIAWQLDNYSGTALSSTALPITAPILSDWDNNIIRINGGVGGIPSCYEKTFNINAQVFSAVLIPEPMSILFFSFALLALRKNK